MTIPPFLVGPRNRRMTLPEWEALQKPEPSRTSEGRAAAKATGEAYISPPNLSRAYLLAKAGKVDLLGLPTVPVQQPADDTAAPLSKALTQWVYARLNPLLPGQP